MSSQVKVHYTPEEYLALESQAEYKSEYFNGEIFAMTGASRRHNLVAANVLAPFHGQLRKRPRESIPVICGLRLARQDFILTRT